MRFPKALKPFLLITAILFFLLVAFTLAINFFYLKDLKSKAEVALSKVLEADCRMESLSIDLLRGITAKGFTLAKDGSVPLSIRTARISLDLRELLSRKVAVKEISLLNATLKLADRTNSYLPYWQGLVKKFTASEDSKAKDSLVSVDISSVQMRDFSLVNGNSLYAVDKLAMRKEGTSIQMELASRKFLGIMDGELSVKKSNRTYDAQLVARVLHPEIRKTCESFTLRTLFTNYIRIPIAVDARGPNLSWKSALIVQPKEQLLVCPAESSVGMYSDVPFSVGITLRDFKKLFYDCDFQADALPLALFKKELSGNLRIRALVSGNIVGKSWSLDSVSAQSERIDVVHLLSNSTSLRGVDLSIRKNSLTRFVCTALLDQDVLRLEGTSPNIRVAKPEFNLSLAGESLDLGRIKWDGRILPPPNPGKKAEFSIALSASFLGVSLQSLLLSDVRLRMSIADGKIKGESLSFMAFNGNWTGDFNLVGNEAKFGFAFRNLSLPQVKMGLTGQGNGQVNMKTHDILVRGQVQDESLSFQKFQCENLRSSVLFSNNSILLPDLVASAYKGRIDASLQYDVSLRKGHLKADVANLDVSEMYQALLGPTASRISGKGTLACDVDLLPSGLGLVSGKVHFQKGIIQDTVYQAEIAKKIGNDLLKDIILYDTIKSGFFYQDKLLKIRDMEFVSTDLEVRMGLDYDLAGGKRTSVEPYKILMSEVFIQSFPQIMKLPISYVTTKKGRWTLLQIEEKSGQLKPVKD